MANIKELTKIDEIKSRKL